MQSTVILARQYGSRTSATLNSIIAVLGGSIYAKVLIDGGHWTITADVTFPANIAIEVLPDAIVTVLTGKTFTVLSQELKTYRSDWYRGTVVIQDPVAVSAAATVLKGSQKNPDNLLLTGEYYGDMDDDVLWTNAPTDCDNLSAYVKVVRVTSLSVLQIFTPDESVQRFHVRTMSNGGIWGSWVKYDTAANCLTAATDAATPLINARVLAYGLQYKNTLVFNAAAPTVSTGLDLSESLGGAVRAWVDLTVTKGTGDNNNRLYSFNDETITGALTEQTVTLNSNQSGRIRILTSATGTLYWKATYATISQIRLRYFQILQ